MKYDAKLGRSRNGRIRSTAICKAMKRKYGLAFSEGKRISIRKSCMGRIKQVKYTVYEAVKTVQIGCTSLRKLSWRLKERGVTTRFIHRGSNPAEEVQGSIFTMNGQTFKASKVDRKFSYAYLCRAIEKNQFVANTAAGVTEQADIELGDPRKPRKDLRQDSTQEWIETPVIKR